MAKCPIVSLFCLPVVRAILKTRVAKREGGSLSSEVIATGPSRGRQPSRRRPCTGGVGRGQASQLHQQCRGRRGGDGLSASNGKVCGCGAAGPGDPRFEFAPERRPGGVGGS